MGGKMLWGHLPKSFLVLSIYQALFKSPTVTVKINIHKASYNPESPQKEQLAIHFLTINAHIFLLNSKRILKTVS